MTDGQARIRPWSVGCASGLTSKGGGKGMRLGDARPLRAWAKADPTEQLADVFPPSLLCHLFLRLGHLFASLARASFVSSRRLYRLLVTLGRSSLDLVPSPRLASDQTLPPCGPPPPVSHPISPPHDVYARVRLPLQAAADRRLGRRKVVPPPPVRRRHLHRELHLDHRRASPFLSPFSRILPLLLPELACENLAAVFARLDPAQGERSVD